MCRSILIQSSSVVLVLLLDNLNPVVVISIMIASISMTKKNAVETCQRLPHAESLLPLDARVVEWQTRTFEGRMPKGLRVQVPPRALLFLPIRNDHFGVAHYSI